MLRPFVGMAAALLLAACAGGSTPSEPQPMPDASDAVRLAATLERFTGNPVECPHDTVVAGGTAIRCVMEEPGPSYLRRSPIFVSVLDDSGRFAFKVGLEPPLGNSPDDYPSGTRSCQSLREPSAFNPAATGLDYAELLYFWMAAGRPTVMDDDGNGIPCETVYPAKAIERTLASPLRIEPYDIGGVARDEVRAFAEALVNGTHDRAGDLVCPHVPPGTALSDPAETGWAAQCRVATDQPDATFTGWFGLAVLDGTGKFVLARFGQSPAATIIDHPEDDNTCEALRSPDVPGGLNGFSYPQTVWWWMWHGSPRDLDPEGNGWPCDDVYPAEEVAATLAMVQQPPAH